MEQPEIKNEAATEADYIKICLNCTEPYCAGGGNGKTCPYTLARIKKEQIFKRDIYREEVLRLYKQGHSYRKVAELTGVSPGTVRRICTRAGVVREKGVQNVVD